MEEITRELVQAAKTDKPSGEFDSAELKRYISDTDPIAHREEAMNALPGMEQENRLFISYAHKDNELFDEAVAIFAKDVSNFYSAKTGNTLNYFFDRQSIGWGENWRAEIDRGLDNSMVFMPIITMQYFNRAACRDELNAFKSSAERLGVRELILPVVIAGARSIKADHEIPEVRIIESLQYRDLESAFLAGPGTPEWRTALSALTDELIGIIDRVEAEQEARRSSGQPVLPSDAAAEGEDADLLQGMADLSTLSERVEEEITEANQAVEAWVEAISKDMESFSNQKTPQQMQAVSLRMASKAKEPSIRLRDAGTALATTTAEADALLRFMIEQLSQTESPEARGMAKQLTESMQEESPDLQSLLAQMSGVLSMLTVFEVMSSPLRASLKPARVGINKLQDAFRIVDSWSSLPKIT
ncbi:toll/interleukin-1 receptor domain-containing protein [Streptomyces pseudogriseolus]|uniref:toll/interleukin-1 receptor domain-containing protein n=1 Tax=Streptomyces pseudogriseolus TaxID=36817 RepID=UPI003FA1D121